MNISHLTPGELGFPGGASWSCGCLGVNGINWEQLASCKDLPKVPVGGQALAIQLFWSSCPQQVRAHRCILQLMPPGLALSPHCTAPPVAVPSCPVVEICLDKEQDSTCRDESKSHPSKQQGPEG